MKRSSIPRTAVAAASADIAKKTNLEDEVARLKRSIRPLSLVVYAMTDLVERPERTIEGYRWDKPGLMHFCLLRAALIVSGLNAALELSRIGFTQQVAVILQAAQAHTAQVDWVLASVEETGVPSGDAQAFLHDFFTDKDLPEGSASWTRYPQSMELYGGSPGFFHLNGMAGTPKAAEPFELLNQALATANLCFAFMVQDLKLHGLVLRDPLLGRWLHEVLDTAARDATR